MSRAFTSEEYEEKEVVYEDAPKIEKSADEDLVYDYYCGRDMKDPAVAYEIGMHFLTGDEGFFHSDEFAVKWLSRASDMGLTKAMLALAEFRMKDSKTYPFKDTARLVKKAAELGDSKATEYLNMNDVDPASKKAYTAYRLNGELGDADACIKLAEGFEKEYYGKDKFKAAASWYYKAYKLGNADAAKRILNLHYKKKITLTDEELRRLRR